MLSEKQKDIIIKILKPYQPRYIGVFGSFARNEESSESDIDLLYDFNKPISLFALTDINEKLMERLNKKVDFIAKSALHPGIERSILKDLITIYGT
ncbi:nucleotidyltransferase domain-containing protein [Aquimarina sp. ERC-38]|uniref:nucleotidyltransferase family protein n=1 Tax=Aquimarina sp. ERC-38 TaxID=2949996 RepID=UPI002245B56A|nr:nucleotidyltransferase domain-containing protein [Aquimarina sp. ERC-38]UZO80964.1 nucleotidyltransferase domain-containing protein [Aquimarina sp. ERC-38]